ncbi:MAG: hypothetical protein ACYSUR_06370 [Planctomycetota bacterium]|jgi:hypothetical protein
MDYRRIVNQVVVSAAMIAAGFTAPAQAGGGACTAFFNQAEFEAFCIQQGKVIKGLEDFEPPIGNVPPYALALLTPTLQGNVPNVDPNNGYGFPGGLANKNLVIQSNALGPQAVVVAPGDSLVGMGPGFWDQDIPNSIVVGPDTFSDSLDLIFTAADNHTGVGFDVIVLGVAGGNVYLIAFDKNNQVIAQETVPAQVDKAFFGIWCPQTIGRINIGGLGDGGEDGGELVDNIELWMERGAPCPCDCETTPDGAVDVGDFLALLAQWGTPGTCDCEDPPDGAVDVGDFLALLAAWGPCPECETAPDCDDGDDCTSDECVDGECVNTPIVPCCGNGVVEPGEQCDPPNDQACPGLCGPDCLCDIPACGHPAAGDCCSANGTPACDDFVCCDFICEVVDPFCCDVAWDAVCADYAWIYCICP